MWAKAVENERGQNASRDMARAYLSGGWEKLVSAKLPAALMKYREISRGQKAYQ